MITRNLRSVSKNASNTSKYALVHAHKRGIINLNNSLSAKPIASTSVSSNQCKPNTTNHSQHSFSKTQQSQQTPNNIIPNIQNVQFPSNLNLSEQQQQNMRNILINLSNTNQTNLVQLILDRIQSDTPQILNQTAIDVLTQNANCLVSIYNTHTTCVNIYAVYSD